MLRTAVLLAVLALIGGCGGSGHASSTATGAKALTGSELRSLLLTVHDMPAGFSVDNSNSGAKADDPSSKLCNVQTAELAPQVGKANVAFAGGQWGPEIIEGLTSYATEDLAKREMTKLRSAVSKCTKFDDKDANGTVTHWTLGELSFPTLTSDQIAQRLNGSFECGTVVGDFVVAREGAVVVAMGGVSLMTFLGGGQLKPGQVEAAARKAVDKVNAGT
jgi:hypothetical protein